MNSAIEGPNCIDPKNCRGECCSIKIDVPKVLAEEFIKRDYASVEDFIRSNIFAFHLRFNEKTGKCFLFDLETNGCSVHNSGIKPPQCWIYPTGFSNLTNKDISCKKMSGWRVKNTSKAIEAEKILQKYVFLCKLEAKEELKRIETRIASSHQIKDEVGCFNLLNKLKNIKPSELAGVIDKWDYVDTLSAEGFSLQMKKFCMRYNPECKLLPNKYFECNLICESISNKLYNFIVNTLYEFIKKNGQDPEGEYSLIKLFNFNKIDI
jgi:Fe-S-cluster containining protein